jgi:hypothetical protein
LSVASDKPATVLINDRPSGNTPARLGLDPGIYRVKLQYADKSESPVKFVTIDAGSKERLAF